MRSLETEALCPKYARVERERRWLVDAARLPELDTSNFILIEDRYIEHTRFRLRRMTDAVTGRTSLKLTKKYDAVEPTARPIVTAYTSPDEFDLLAVLPA